jgi:hypothetical protein
MGLALTSHTGKPGKLGGADYASYASNNLDNSQSKVRKKTVIELAAKKKPSGNPEGAGRRRCINQTSTVRDH